MLQTLYSNADYSNITGTSTIDTDDGHDCVFCGEYTNFQDKGNYYCIDCYVKLRNSAHTHDLPVNPQPLTPVNPFVIDHTFKSNLTTFIC